METTRWPIPCPIYSKSKRGIHEYQHQSPKKECHPQSVNTIGSNRKRRTSQ